MHNLCGIFKVALWIVFFPIKKRSCIRIVLPKRLFSFTVNNTMSTTLMDASMLSPMLRKFTEQITEKITEQLEQKFLYKLEETMKLGSQRRSPRLSRPQPQVYGDLLIFSRSFW